ncbi:MAG: LysM peptidoglycan-binding domain-containing protein [Anaerolineales bacterium]
MKRILTILAIGLSFSAFSAVRAQAEIPNQAYISGVNGHAQTFSLSCESRSAADWAAYWGVSINESVFIDQLPRSDNPNEGFVGNPNDPWGYIPPSSYGVHAEPVARLLRDYGLDAHAGIGLSWDEARNEVAAGRPVIVWIIGSIWSETPKEYETQGGQTVTVANNEHTMILIGYDESRVHLVDALTGYTVTHPLKNFLNSWAVLGNMAVVGEGSGETPGANTDQGDPNSAYTVQRGDTLNKVANRFGLAWPDLAAWNNISYPYLIYPGQTLLLNGEAQANPTEEPAPAEPRRYIVKKGDYLLKIARKLKMDWAVLARFNDLTPPFMLQLGDVLNLPEIDLELADLPVPDTYTAMRTERIVDIAHYFGLDWISLAGLNNLSSPYMIYPGQTIQLKANN